MADNAADRKDIRRKEKEARIADRQRREVIGQIMSTAPGRAWLWDRLSSCHVFHTTFNGDALASAFQEGQRSVGLALLADILAHCPDQYIQAMREANERHDRNDNPASGRTDPDAERLGSPLTDGGDSGTGADSGADPDSADASIPRVESALGADIYTSSPTSNGSAAH